MDYIKRDLERKFMHMSSAFKAVMVVGARQVGKSTMLKHLAEGQNRTYVTMDDTQLRNFAQTEPKLFLQTFQPPILIDEVQKAPELFEEIKIICDNSDERGQFWLTGSQSKKLVKKAGDSLAGRLCILKMYSLSAREKLGIEPAKELEFSLDSLVARQKLFPANNIVKTFENIWRGGLPDVQEKDEEQFGEYFNSYIETYLMRDAVDDYGITDSEGFRKFLRACAAFTGQLVNYNDLGISAGVSGVTAKDWVKVLQSMGIVFLLEPFASNELKRLTKTPKLYFCDTGFCAYLSSWTSKEVLVNGAASGHFYENYVIGELLRNYEYGRNRVNLNFFRNNKMKEIDLIIEENGILHPVEIKKTASPDISMIKSFSALKSAERQVGAGAVICMSDKVLPFDKSSFVIPSGII
ncbi:MAG: ATP-binding protein [Oscillospiraceae bacterium]|nr:ATP-binding protein [Oscillospiraceae bacterium]